MTDRTDAHGPQNAADEYLGSEVVARDESIAAARRARRNPGAAPYIRFHEHRYGEPCTGRPCWTEPQNGHGRTSPQGSPAVEPAS